MSGSAADGGRLAGRPERRPAPWRWLGVAGLVGLAVLCVAPVAALVPATLLEHTVAASALSVRRVGLLLTSVRLATLVLVADALVAGVVALWAHTAPRGRAMVVLAAALAAGFVPPVAHAAAWAGMGEWLRRLLHLTATPIAGFPGAFLAQSSAYLPLAIAIALVGVLAVDPALVDASRVFRPDGTALSRVVLPLSAPAILAGGGIAAVLSLGDEAVPAAFGVDTAAMELFASFAADGRAARTLALAWPLTLVAIVVAVACAAPLRRASLAIRWGRRGWSAPARIAAGMRVTFAVTVAAVVGSSTAVFAALIAGAMPPGTAASAVASAASDIATTVLVAATCGLVAFGVGGLAGAPAGPSAPPSRLVWAIALLALVVPAPVTGAGLVALLNNPWSGAVYDSPAILVLASLARFAPLAAIVVAVTAARLDRRVLEAAVIARRPGTSFVRVVVPQLAPAAAVGGLLVGAFAAGELGATLMVLPAGTSTAVVRAFNLLHYGASQQVAAIALAVAVLGVGAAAAAFALGRRALGR